jgi:hypothetical protein
MLAKWTALCLFIVPLLPAQESPMAGAPSGLLCEYLIGFIEIGSGRRRPVG